MAIKIRKNTAEKTKLRDRRHKRIRKKVSGTAERHRLCVTRSNRALTVQLIDDDAAKTLLSQRTQTKTTANIESAKELGKALATQAKSKGIETVVFDRGGYIYHGKIAALAAGAREGGLNF